MKITDITVGNFVCNKNNELCKICVVDLITNSVIVDNYAHDDGTFYEYTVEELKPIPLTTGFLENNEFVLQHGVYVYDNDGEEIYVSLPTCIYPFTTIKDEFGLHSETLKGNISVHIFQQILKMFGLNDLADNFNLNDKLIEKGQKYE